MNELVARLYKKFPSLKKEQVLTRAMVIAVTQGEKVDWSFINRLEKISHGKYAFNASAFDECTPPKMKKTRAKRVAVVQNFVAPVEQPQVQNVQVTTDRRVNRNNPVVIPARDSNYVPFGHFSDVSDIIKSRIFFPIYITGHSGNGKSSMPLEICARANIPLVRMNITAQTSYEDLIGSKSLSEGNIVIEEGPVLIAMRNGAILLLEELDAANANNIMCLQGILEGKPFYFPLTNEYITPAPGFNIVATGNTKGKGSDDGRYVGTNVLNDAFLERFGAVFEQEFPPASAELKMVTNWMVERNCLDEKFANDLIKWSTAIRKTFEDGGIDDLIATRRLKHAVECFAIFKNKKKAIMLVTGRFDTMTAGAFRSVFDKISGDDTPVQKSPTNEEAVVNA